MILRESLKTMKSTFIIKNLFIAFTLLSVFFWGGCGKPAPEQKPLEEPLDRNVTVGSLATIIEIGQTDVGGYGIVAGLNGTGSSECPPALREMLVQHMLKQMTKRGTFDPDKFINSRDTAVVEIYGVMPALGLVDETFDVRVAALPNTQTTSLEGGRLYSTDLKQLGRVNIVTQYTQTLAEASGPVFMDMLDGAVEDPTQGYILGGATILSDTRVMLILNEADYRTAAAIRNRINERFGDQTADAVTPGDIEIRFPPEYYNNKVKFLEMIRNLYLISDSQLIRQKIDQLTEKLSRQQDPAASEVALTAIGRAAIAKLVPLLEHPAVKVRFRAARILLDLGDDRGLAVMREIVTKPGPEDIRIAAVEAMGISGERNEVIPILNHALSLPEFDIRFEAYRQLKRLGDVVVSSELVAGDFLLDTVTCGGERVVYVSRKDVPKVVIFGSPLYAEGDVYVTSPDGSATINARQGEAFVQVMRRHPRRPRLIGPVDSPRSLPKMIKTLCEDPVSENPAELAGLGINYSSLLPILEQMCLRDAIKARFIASDMTEAGASLEKQAQ